MVPKIHFISGLPRSGSTLLSAVLRQNPRFTAGMTSPLSMLCGALHQKMGPEGEFGPFFSDSSRATILRGVFNSYYAPPPETQVVFDTNRAWTGKAALLATLYPDSRIICCVRHVGWIMDSIEHLIAKSPLHLSRLFNAQTGHSVYARVDALVNSEIGLIGSAWSSFREAWFGEYAGRLLVIQYEKFVNEPDRILRRLYEELGEKPYTHDFENVAYSAPDYDALMGLPGMHDVRKRISHLERKPCIPPELFAKGAEATFWVRPELNLRGVRIL